MHLYALKKAREGISAECQARLLFDGRWMLSPSIIIGLNYDHTGGSSFVEISSAPDVQIDWRRRRRFNLIVLTTASGGVRHGS